MGRISYVPKYNKYGKSGWYNESQRHSLARQGIKTKVDYMFDLETIKQMNRERAKEARTEGRKPLVYDGVPEDLRSIPNFGDYRPKGWKLVETYFVDSSGFGQPGEMALTFNQFSRRATVGKGYAIIEAGQFQVKIGEFERIGEKINTCKKVDYSKKKDFLEYDLINKETPKGGPGSGYEGYSLMYGDGSSDIVVVNDIKRNSWIKEFHSEEADKNIKLGNKYMVYCYTTKKGESGFKYFKDLSSAKKYAKELVSQHLKITKTDYAKKSKKRFFKGIEDWRKKQRKKHEEDEDDDEGAESFLAF